MAGVCGSATLVGSPFPARFGAKRGNLGMELTGKVWCVNPRSRSRAALCHVLSAAVGWLARPGKGKVKGNSAPRGRGEREEEINPHPLAQPLVPCLLLGGGISTSGSPSSGFWGLPVQNPTQVSCADPRLGAEALISVSAPGPKTRNCFQNIA